MRAFKRGSRLSKRNETLTTRLHVNLLRAHVPPIKQSTYLDSTLSASQAARLCSALDLL